MSKPNTRKIRFFRIHQKLDKASILPIYMQKLGLYLQLDVKYSYINGMYSSKNQFVTISDKKQFQ